MKAVNLVTLVAALLSICGAVAAGGEALAQTKPDTGRGAEAVKPSPRIEPPERRAAPTEPGEKAPSEEGSSAQDEMQSAPGCVDGGRKLELIV
jgi:hypothetical protein